MFVTNTLVTYTLVTNTLLPAHVTGNIAWNTDAQTRWQFCEPWTILVGFT